MKAYYYRNKLIIRNIVIIFILFHSIFSPDNLAKYLLGGMGIALVLLNLKAELENSKNKKYSEKACQNK